MNALGVSISISSLFLKFIVTYEGYLYVIQGHFLYMFFSYLRDDLRSRTITLNILFLQFNVCSEY